MIRPVDRVDFTFSPSGDYAVCLRCADDQVSLERWTLTSRVPSIEPLTVAVDRGTTTLPLDDGQVAILRSDGTDPSAPHRVGTVHPATGTVRQLGEIPAVLGAYLVPSPEPGTLAFVVARHDPEHSSIWRLPAGARGVEKVVGVPGCLSGGVWLDSEARLLAANQTSPSHTSSGVVVDMHDGTWRRIWSMSRRSNDRITLYSPRSRLLVLTTDVSGEERIGWGSLGRSEVRFPENLHQPASPWRAWALDPRGERVLTHRVTGAVSRLSIVTPASESVEPLDVPAGIASGPASWSETFLRVPFSSPRCPPTLATVALDSRRPERRTTVHEDRSATWAAAELVQLDGPSRPIEAIAYGGARWRRAPVLVVALHGGPLSAWGFEFQPLFQALSAAGAAIVAPNYRGSTGYGDEHLRSVIGSWGGPDLDDVSHLARRLDRERAPLGLPAPVVLGVSYGAYLALLAACHEPQLWSACVALAPFLSGPRLHAGTRDPAVRDRIERLGGLAHAEYPERSNDVLDVCEALRAPLLLVHGTRDLTIPVEQSRELVRRPVARADGDAAREYLEVEADHEEVTLARRDALRRRIVRFCLSRSRLARRPDDRTTHHVAKEVEHHAAQ
ncbi:MAG: alpha/beta hydrolase family protein [Streptosporangiales bacterium]